MFKLGSPVNFAATVREAFTSQRTPSASLAHITKRLLSFKEAGNWIGVSEDTIEGLVDDGELPAVEVGRGKKKRRRRIDPDDLDTFIQRRKQRGTSCISTKTAGTTRRNSGSKASAVVDLQSVRLAERQKRLLDRSRRI